MAAQRPNNLCRWYLEDMTHRIVAESGKPSDRYHLGKLIMRSFMDDSNYTVQIDAGTGQSETSGSVLHRMMQCSKSFKRAGLKPGDTIVLIAPNHIDVTIPFFAAFYSGLKVAPTDINHRILELKKSFAITKPKMIFCQSGKASDIQKTLSEINSEAKIVSFDGGDHLWSFQDFMKSGDNEKCPGPADIDPEEAICLLIPTSGSTGQPKVINCTHKNIVLNLPSLWLRYTKFPQPVNSALIASPMIWLTAMLMFIGSAILRITNIQSSLDFTTQHCKDIIRVYKPEFKLLNPTFMTRLFVESAQKNDLSSFKSIILCGSAVSADLVKRIKENSPSTEVYNGCGMSETGGFLFTQEHNQPIMSSGKPLAIFDYKLINPATQEIITEPDTPGELLVKGPGLFKGYCDNEEGTRAAFTEDGWFKTGDLFYRDASDFFYFVERIKFMLKYKNYQISPVEIENVIRQHPGVLDVAVSSVPSQTCGDLPVAIVVPEQDHDVTAKEIKNIVKDSLSDAKQLHGGVIFVDTLPTIPTGKVDRGKLKEIVFTSPRE